MSAEPTADDILNATTGRHEPGDCCADLNRKLDRILDLLTERRKPTVKQQVDDLIERYERGLISGPEAYKRITQVRLAQESNSSAGTHKTKTEGPQPNHEITVTDM